MESYTASTWNILNKPDQTKRKCPRSLSVLTSVTLKVCYLQLRNLSPSSPSSPPAALDRQRRVIWDPVAAALPCCLCHLPGYSSFPKSNFHIQSRCMSSAQILTHENFSHLPLCTCKIQNETYFSQALSVFQTFLSLLLMNHHQC